MFSLLLSLVLFAAPASQTFPVEGVERTALVYAPERPTDHPPVVFVYHGHGGNSNGAARSFRIHEHWPEALVLYPQGLPTRTPLDPAGARAGWQHSAGVEGDRDLKFFDAMLAWAEKTHRADPGRVFVCGHSNGGKFTYLLWSARHEKLRAVGPSAAAFGREILTAKPLPAFLVRGTNDRIVDAQLQARNEQAVLRLNRGDGEKAEEFAPGVKLTKGRAGGADTVAFVHDSGHRMPATTGERLVAFFRRY